MNVYHWIATRACLFVRLDSKFIFRDSCLIDLLARLQWDVLAERNVLGLVYRCSRLSGSWSLVKCTSDHVFCEEINEWEEWVSGWMCGWVGGLVSECGMGWMDGWMGWMDGWMDKWMDGWREWEDWFWMWEEVMNGMNEWMNEWMDGWVEWEDWWVIMGRVINEWMEWMRVNWWYE